MPEIIKNNLNETTVLLFLLTFLLGIGYGVTKDNSFNNYLHMALGALLLNLQAGQKVTA